MDFNKIGHIPILLDGGEYDSPSPRSGTVEVPTSGINVFLLLGAIASIAYLAWNMGASAQKIGAKKKVVVPPSLTEPLAPSPPSPPLPPPTSYAGGYVYGGTYYPPGQLPPISQNLSGDPLGSWTQVGYIASVAGSSDLSESVFPLYARYRHEAYQNYDYKTVINSVHIDLAKDADKYKEGDIVFLPFDSVTEYTVHYNQNYT